ncbi:MAG: hypothetical protein JRM72_01615 [Nitrososphaerota archaeon]|nr:hypothetical protein [Nitrososphaerota archaeon]
MVLEVIGTEHPLESGLNARYKDRPFSVTVSNQTSYLTITKKESDFITIGTKYAYRLNPFTITMQHHLTAGNVLILRLDKNKSVSRGIKVSPTSRIWHADVFTEGICLGQSADLLKRRIPIDAGAPDIIISNFEVVEAILSNTEKPDSIVAGAGIRLGKTRRPRVSNQMNLKKVAPGVDIAVRH